MPVESQLIMLGGATLCVIFYLAAGRIYDFHSKLKQDGHSLSKIVSGDHKHLDNRALWIKRYRIKVFLLLVLVVTVPLINHYIF